MLDELKKRWVEALRSGEYKQGRTYLRRGIVDKPDEYCCLGVLYDIVDGVWTEKNFDGFVTFSTDEGSVTHLSRELMSSVGLIGELEEELISMNDNDISFEEIAKVIEEKA